ncbi:MAG: hypothetical protein JW754_03100 [Candidatus Aenigmarchaeota archaeon]|nr:hypothetical protein [Candidatus Aenigmarchaeota archaeon]
MWCFLNKKFRKGIIRIEKGGKPYIRKICSISRINVWLVDGEHIRSNICEDFVNYAHHYQLTFIPKNEFWIAEGTDEDEMRYYIDRMLTEYRLITGGMKYKEASYNAAIFEKRERAKSEIMKKLTVSGKDRKDLIKMVHKKKLKIYSNGVSVWLVDGELVRSLFYLDYGGGGHDRVYHFIPRNEIWIDDDIPINERKFIILHELHERNLMSRGMNYAAGHKSATEKEDHYRHYPKGIQKAIRKEMDRQKTD